MKKQKPVNKFVLASWLIVAAVVLLGPARVQADQAQGNPVAPGQSHKTDWMFKAKVGMSTHFFATQPKTALNRLAEQFQAEKVAEQAAEAGAGWFLFTLHHQQWAFMAPNSTYDRLMGNSDQTAERDVPAALYKALAPKGIKLMLYVNLRLDPGSACPPAVRTAMGGWPPSDKLIANVAAVYRELSIRYGENVAGWWVDGVWMGAYKNSPHREQWFAAIAEALRAGNPDALVAFNPGRIETYGMIRYSPQNDYTAGEHGMAGSYDKLTFVPQSRWVDGAQCHVWTFLGENWQTSGLRFDDTLICDYARRVIAGGGVLTLEVGTLGRSSAKLPPGSDPNSRIGQIDPAQVRQVKRLVEAVQRGN